MGIKMEKLETVQGRTYTIKKILEKYGWIIDICENVQHKDSEILVKAIEEFNEIYHPKRIDFRNISGEQKVQMEATIILEEIVSLTLQLKQYYRKIEQLLKIS